MDSLAHVLKSWLPFDIGGNPLDEYNSDFEEENKKPKVRVEIQYCGGCGFATRFDLARELILKEFERDKDKLEVVPLEDAGMTGNFEVRVDGTLVHSKKTMKHAFLHNDPKQQVIVLDFIQERLDKLAEQQIQEKSTAKLTQNNNNNKN